MMHDQQVCPGRDSQLHGGEARVHGGGNAGDGASVFHLQTVHCAIPIVERCSVQQTSAMAHDVSETLGWHVRDQSKLPVPSKTKLSDALNSSSWSRRTVSSPSPPLKEESAGGEEALLWGMLLSPAPLPLN